VSALVLSSPQQPRTPARPRICCPFTPTTLLRTGKSTGKSPLHMRVFLIAAKGVFGLYFPEVGASHEPFAVQHQLAFSFAIGRAFRVRISGHWPRPITRSHGKD